LIHPTIEVYHRRAKHGSAQQKVLIKRFLNGGSRFKSSRSDSKGGNFHISRILENLMLVRGIARGSLAFAERVKRILGPGPCTAKSSRQVRHMFCENRVKLTGANLPRKTRR